MSFAPGTRRRRNSHSSRTSISRAVPADKAASASSMSSSSSKARPDDDKATSRFRRLDGSRRSRVSMARAGRTRGPRGSRYPAGAPRVAYCTPVRRISEKPGAAERAAGSRSHMRTSTVRDGKARSRIWPVPATARTCRGFVKNHEHGPQRLGAPASLAGKQAGPHSCLHAHRPQHGLETVQLAVDLDEQLGRAQAR